MNPEASRPDPAAQTNGTAETARPTGSQPANVPSDLDSETRVAPPSSVSVTAVLQSIGEYLVVKKIGEGGMGSVYLAEDTKLERKVAIKTMKAALAADRSNRERFEREARAAAAVEHENIVPIWRIGEAADGSPFIAMPFLQGESLADRLRRQPVAGLSVLLKVAREVAEGLAAAHAKGLIHRDIKPGNIWLEGDTSSKQLAEQVRRCKILDFGLARSVESEEEQLTKSGVILGTPEYMAPEQALGEAVDHRVDLFSLGVVLFRMATGKMPFRGDTAVSVMIALTTETADPVWTVNPNLPPALSDLIDRLLSKDPAGRPQTATEVSGAVRQIAKDLQGKNLSGGAAPVSPPVRPPLASRPPIVSADRREPTPVANPRPPEPEEVTEAELVPVPKVAPKPKSAPKPEPEAPKRARAPKAKAHKSSKRNRTPVLVAGAVFALFAVLALALVIVRGRTAEGTFVVEFSDPSAETRLKNGKLVLVGTDGKDRYTVDPAERNKKIAAGSYTIRVEGADGLALDTKDFTLKKGEQVTVRVALDPKTVARKPDPPKVAPPKVDPPKAAAPNLAADRRAAEYILSVGGAVVINDQGPEITAANDLPREPFRLTTVRLSGNKQATDAGLAVFADCENVTALDLQGAEIGDAGLMHFRGCKGMRFLAISQKLTDAGLVLLDDWNELGFFWVGGTKVTDAGMAALRGRAKVTDVRIGGTAVTDTGLAHLKECKGLTYLWLPGTKVTANGVADFASAMPRCKIVWDGGTIEPTKK